MEYEPMECPVFQGSYYVYNKNLYEYIRQQMVIKNEKFQEYMVRRGKLNINDDLLDENAEEIVVDLITKEKMQDFLEEYDREQKDIVDQLNSFIEKTKNQKL